MQEQEGLKKKKKVKKNAVRLSLSETFKFSLWVCKVNLFGCRCTAQENFT